MSPVFDNKRKQKMYVESPQPFTRKKCEAPSPDHAPVLTLTSLMFCVTADILAHQVLLNRVPEQATEDSVRYQIYY